MGGCAALPGLFDCHQLCQISELALRTSLLLSLPHCQDQTTFCRGGGELHRIVKQNSLNLPLMAASASFCAKSLAKERSKSNFSRIAKKHTSIYVMR